MDFIQKNGENDAILWKFQQIIGHQGPLKLSDTHYVGLRFNVQVEWENGETTYEPLGVIAEPDIWMRQVGNQYKYVAVYVDSLAITSNDPSAIIDALNSTHGFNLKGTSPIEYHLGMASRRDEHGMLCISSRRYIDKMVDTYQQLFGCKPSTKALSLLEKGDHPEIDDSEFLNEEDTQKYQSMVGAMQWAISIG